MILLFAFCGDMIYGESDIKRTNQAIGAFCSFAHYFRRVIESNFVHKFTEQLLPWASIPAIMFYYWILFGYLVAYFLLKPGYQPWFQFNDVTYLALGALFMLFEALNFRCHCITASLRKPGSNVRGVP